MFNNIYNNRKVFITGHTGFKGSWLVRWLQKMGAKLYGYSLEPPTKPSHYKLLNPDIHSTIGDIRDLANLQKSINTAKPEIVFHLAAQPLVRLSYQNPIDTFSTNVMGTLNVLEACRQAPSVCAILNITSDKCYDNQEWIWGYRENDPMGGRDPYSASKGCSELLTSSYRQSFFNNNETLLASCRAGNVIGGGDWAEDRLIPDIIRAITLDKPVELRNPDSTRPWQHVLEPLSGYLLLGQKLLSGKNEYAEAWNFGPSENDVLSVEEVVKLFKEHWSKIQYKRSTSINNLHEAELLKIDSSKARQRLKWHPVWDKKKTIIHTVDWYKNYYENNKINTDSDIAVFEKDMKIGN
jgi:CDP-glucose 4,6-dehydratase